MSLELDKLENSVVRFDELAMKMSDPEFIADREAYTKAAKEYSDLEPLVEAIKRLKELQQGIEDNKLMITESEDQEFRELVREELNEFEAEYAELEKEVEVMLVPEDPNDKKNVIMEIRGGAGGDEAALFASELMNMYQYFAEKNGWKVEIIDLNTTELGGVKEAVFEVMGKGAYSQLKYESGVHRVQRVPETEAGGRIHTSTCTVAVLPEAEDVDIQIDPKDLEIDTYRASGAGGQHVNKTSSAIRITHLPTGTVVTCQDERSQHKNRDKAMRVLMARLQDMEQRKQESKIAGARKSQVGTGDRSERIRTYNFPQGRVTDHRVGLTLYKLEAVLQGEIDEFITALQAKAHEEAIESNSDFSE